MDANTLGLSLVLVADVIGSIALAAWLGLHAAPSDWDRS